MNKNLEQAEQVTIKGGASSPRPSSSNQQTDGSSEGMTSDEAVYGDASVPYVPLSENNLPTWQMAKTPSLPRVELATPRASEADGMIVLLGTLLGAGLGALLAYFTKANPLPWMLIGAVTGGTLTFVICSLHSVDALDLPLLNIFDHWPW